MRLAFFLVWKSWASSRLRVALTLAGVSLGVAVVTAVHVLDHNTVLSELERKRGDYGRVDLELRPLRADADLEAMTRSLSAEPGVARVGLLIRADVTARTGSEAPAALFGLAPARGEVFGHYRVAAGRDLEDGEEGVLLGPELAARLGAAPGTRLALEAKPWAGSTRCLEGRLEPLPGREEPGGPPRFEVTVRGILAPFRLGRQEGGLVAVGAFALARRLARPCLPHIQVNRTPGTDPDRLVRALEGEFHVDDARTALIGEAADERAFRNGVRVLAGLALVLGMFVIFHTLSHSLAGKIRGVGLLRALGAGRGQVTLGFLLDALLLSLAGTALGLLLGLGLARLLGALEITTLGLGKRVATFAVPWRPLAAIAAMSIFFTLLGAAFPLLKVHRLAPRRILQVRDLAPPADLMRGVNLFLFAALVVGLPLGYLALSPLLADEGRGAGLVLLQAAALVAAFFALLLLSPRLVRALGAIPIRLARPFLPLAAFLVQKNLLRSPGRLASAVCGLTLVALSLVGLRALTGALKGEIREFARAGLRGRLFLRTEPVGDGLLPRLRAVPGVAALLPLTEPVALPFVTLGTDAAELARPGGPLAGREDLAAAMAGDRGMLVSSRLAGLRHLGPGSRVAVPTNAGTVVYRVLQVTDGAGFFPDERAVALVDRRWLHWDFCLPKDLTRRYEVRLRPGADPKAAEAALRQAFSPYTTIGWVRNGEEIEADHLADVDRDFLFFDILLALLLLLAGTGQVNLMTLTALARSREIGVLRALGLTRGEFLRVLLLEAAVVGFAACLITAAAGLPLSWILVRGLQEVSGLAVPWDVPWTGILLAAAASAAVSLAAALPPAWRATGLPPATAVRSSE